MPKFHPRKISTAHQYILESILFICNYVCSWRWYHLTFLFIHTARSLTPVCAFRRILTPSPCIKLSAPRTHTHKYWQLILNRKCYAAHTRQLWMYAYDPVFGESESAIALAMHWIQSVLHEFVNEMRKKKYAVIWPTFVPSCCAEKTCEKNSWTAAVVYQWSEGKLFKYSWLSSVFLWVTIAESFTFTWHNHVLAESSFVTLWEWRRFKYIFRSYWSNVPEIRHTKTKTAVLRVG